MAIRLIQAKISPGVWTITTLSVSTGSRYSGPSSRLPVAGRAPKRIALIGVTTCVEPAPLHTGRLLPPLRVATASGPPPYGGRKSRDAVDYPDAVSSTHPLASYLTGRSKNDVKPYAGAPTELFCFRCSFEPWAETGAVDTVTVTVMRALGRNERVPATFDPVTRRWVAPVALAAGDSVYVAAGDVRDTFGERNGAPSARTTWAPAAVG